MGYHKSIQKTIEHIELHLGDSLSLHELAEITGFSDYHFHRVFQTMVGDPVMEYVRKRRLARAAREVANLDKRIVDIALDHGFQTHETFTRAFKKLFGMTPGEYRKSGIRTPAYPKADVLSRRFNPYLGGIRMDYRIVTKPAFKLIGYELRTTSEEGQNNKEIPAFWQRYLEERKGERIPNAVHKDSVVELGLCTDFEMDTSRFSYIIGMEAEHFGNVPEDLVCREFPEATYAVFTTPKARHEDFVSSIQSTWMTIFGEWFPHSGYEHSGGPEFEWYDERCHQDKHELLQIDIYIPVKKKEG
ncbi:AraC family transcriptional regulator [Cohnella kolymensis]|uniref:AraC family transcriptional regulator n=1 Tax=Cohnella kolymensis TaxID=1590652 RepID=A0ABR5A995_9BACL|nr:AraC family transcriptional regulator [Cohnella kolymensis]KIL37621.1 AraC family transcriptional regulator [Cohnella kolymensis]